MSNTAVVRGLPNETTARFVLLILGAGAVALALSEALWYSVFLTEANEVLSRCLAQSGGDLATERLCGRPQEHQRVLWTLSVAALTLALGVIGAMVGSVVRRRRWLSPAPWLGPIDANAVRPVLDRLGLQSIPLLYRRSRPTGQARADGLSRPYVEVGQNWLGTALQDPPRARALLHHEMHHILARDVLPSRVTLWITPAVVGLGVVYLATIVTSDWTALLAGAVRTIAAVAVVVLGRAAVLRAREHAADIAAAGYEPDAMVRWFSRATPPKGSFRRWWDVHPSPSERRQVVTDPTQACRLRPVDGILVALIAAIGGPVVSRLWRAWFQTGEPAFWAELVGWGLIGGILGVWIVVMLYRSITVAARTGTESPTGTFSWALAGFLLLGGLVFTAPFGLPFEAPPVSVVSLAGLALIPLGMVAVVAWLRSLIQWWLGLRPSRRRSVAIVVPVAIGALIGATMTGMLANLQFTTTAWAARPDSNSVPTLIQILLVQATSIPGLVLICTATLVPVVLLLLPRRRVTDSADWLAPLPSQLARSRTRRWPQVAAIGIIAGIAGALAVELIVGHGSAPQNWYASIAAVYSAPVVAGAVVAAGSVAGSHFCGSTVLGGLGAAVGSFVATAGVVVVRLLQGDEVSADSFLTLLIDVSAVGIVGGLLLSGLLPTISPGAAPAGTRRALVIAGSVLLVAAPLLLARAVLRAMRASPSVAEDLVQWETVVALSDPDFQLAALACGNDARTSGGVEAAERMVAQLQLPTSTPVTGEVLALRAEMVGVFTACGDGLRRAQRDGDTLIDETAARAINDHLERYEQLLEAAGG